MDTNPKQCELTNYALETVHHKTQKLVGKAGYTQDDVDDIKQDLIVDLLERLPKFDPAKASLNTFIARVVERKICNLLRARWAEVRNRRREVCSLNDNISTGEAEMVQRYTTISQDEYDLSTGKYGLPAEEREHLRLDLAALLAELPPELRRAAELLQMFPVAQVARQMGVPHATFYDQHLTRLREAFAAKGMGDYLKSEVLRHFGQVPGK